MTASTLVFSGRITANNILAMMAIEKEVTKAVRELGYNPDKQSLTIEALSSGRCSVSFGKYWIGIWDTLRKTFVD